MWGSYTLTLISSRPAGTLHKARAAAGPSDLAGEPHLSREEWGRPTLRPDPPGLVPGRRAVSGRAPAEALQQGGSPNAAQTPQQHALVRDPGRPPEGNLFHQGD